MGCKAFAAVEVVPHRSDECFLPCEKQQRPREHVTHNRARKQATTAEMLISILRGSDESRGIGRQRSVRTGV